ncbi:MAG: hypothetical protein KJ955_03325 [Nanoarchaeota archaeon]|nr:hypothetical protein [Nanoarchaeota archaeon]
MKLKEIINPKTISIGLAVAAIGVCRIGPEIMNDERVIEKDRIVVIETYGIMPKQAAFEYNGEHTVITYEGSGIYIPLAVIATSSSELTTLFMNGVCDNNVHMACRGVGTEKVRCVTGGNLGAYDTLRKANEKREELCDILDCAGICEEWKALQ